MSETEQSWQDQAWQTSRASTPVVVNNIPHVPVPPDYRLESLEHLLPAPRRTARTDQVYDEASFLALWNRFSGEDSIIFAEPEAGIFTAIFDYPNAGEPGWAEHRITYAVRPSLAWQAWVGMNGRKTPQISFAEFLESNVQDVLKPEPATLLEIATHLTAHRELKFESGTRLSNGQTQFRYDETLRGTTRSGEVAVPETFTLKISPFFNGELYELTARLRWRIEEGGRLVFWYDLDRPEEFRQKAFERMAGRISEKSETVVIFGKPK